MARRLGWLLGVALTGIAPVAFAQAQEGPPAAADPRFAIPGSRDSASPGQRDPGQAKAKARKNGGPAHGTGSPAGPSVATFPGFRLLPDGRSRIYVELTKAVTVDERRTDRALVYILRGARVLVRNNKNALITTHFATPVARARLLPVGPDVELVIDLRKAVSATQKIVPGDNGTARIEIDFPAGDYPLAPALFGPPQAASERAGTQAGASEPAEEGAEAPAPARLPTAAAPASVPAPAEKSAVGPTAP